MEILSVEIADFRQFYGTQKVRFSTDTEKNITLIHAENGVGKTAFLNAVLWCLFEQTTGNFKHPTELLNHSKKADGEDGYHVYVEFNHLNRLYIAQRRYTRLNGLTFVVYEISDSGNYSQVPSPSLFINTIIPKDMAGYFFFQGEGANSFADNKAGSVRDAIRDVLGFSVAELAISDIKNIKSEFRKELIRVDQTSEVGKIQSEIGSLEQEITLLETQLAKDNAQKDSLSAQADKVDQEYRESNIEVLRVKQSQRDSKQAELSRLEHSKSSIYARKANLIAHYATSVFAKKIADEGIEFIDDKELKGTIPAPFNEQLVKDILEKALCICGAHITEGSEAYVNIHKLIAKAADPMLINRVRRARGQLSGIRKDLSTAQHEFNSVQTDLAVTLRNIDILTRELQELSVSIGQISFDDIADKEQRRTVLKRNLIEVVKGIGAKERDLDQKKKLLLDLQGKVSRLGARTPEIQSFNKKIDFAELLEKKLETVLEETERSSRSLLMKKINDFLSLYVRQDYVAELSENYDIVLRDRNRNKVATSDGQALLLSLTFISALISIAKDRLNAAGEILQPGATAPFVIDAPFGVLDNEYKSNIARELPLSVNQIVLLLSSSHWEGAVEQSIRDRVGVEYNMVLEVASDEKQGVISDIEIQGVLHKTVVYNSRRDMTRIVEVVKC
ncbi:MAG TPA: AAA family ATPase [Methylotenera sp.]